MGPRTMMVHVMDRGGEGSLYGSYLGPAENAVADETSWACLTDAACPLSVAAAGRVHRLRVPPGPEAHVAFQREVRALLGLPQDSDFEVTFECRAPTTGAWHSGACHVMSCTNAA